MQRTQPFPASPRAREATHGVCPRAREQLTNYIQTRLTDFSNYRTTADVELTHIGTLKTILSEARQTRDFPPGPTPWSFYILHGNTNAPPYCPFD